MLKGSKKDLRKVESVGEEMLPQRKTNRQTPGRQPGGDGAGSKGGKSLGESEVVLHCMSLGVRSALMKSGPSL